MTNPWYIEPDNKITVHIVELNFKWPLGEHLHDFELSVRNSSTSEELSTLSNSCQSESIILGFPLLALECEGELQQGKLRATESTGLAESLPHECAGVCPGPKALLLWMSPAVLLSLAHHCQVLVHSCFLCQCCRDWVLLDCLRTTCFLVPVSSCFCFCGVLSFCLTNATARSWRATVLSSFSATWEVKPSWKMLKHGARSSYKETTVKWFLGLVEDKEASSNYISYPEGIRYT